MVYLKNLRSIVVVNKFIKIALKLFRKFLCFMSNVMLAHSMFIIRSQKIKSRPTLKKANVDNKYKSIINADVHYINGDAF